MSQVLFDYTKQDASGASCVAAPGPRRRRADAAAARRRRRRAPRHCCSSTMRCWSRITTSTATCRTWRSRPAAASPIRSRWRASAATIPARTLVVAGVRFMGETAKILSPEKRVLMPDLDATCSLDLGCPPDRIRRLLRCPSRPRSRRLCQYQRRGEGARRLDGDQFVRAGDRPASAAAGPQDPVGARPPPRPLYPAGQRRRHADVERRVHRPRRVQGRRAANC